MVHGLWLGVGSAERWVSDGWSCLLGLSTGPWIFCSLDKASNWERRGEYRKKSDISQRLEPGI